MTPEWRGVVAAGAAWQFQSEAAEAGSTSVTLSQPTVPVHTARGLVQYSIEIEADWANFAVEMQRLLAVEYNEICLSKFTNGTGTGEPTGLITALLAAGGASVVHPTTDGAYSDVDLTKMWATLPGKYRPRADMDVRRHEREPTSLALGALPRLDRHPRQHDRGQRDRSRPPTGRERVLS